MFTPDDLLKRLDAALKMITVDELGQSVLEPAQFDRFVQAAQEKTTILNEARYLKMLAHRVNIDRIGFVGRLLAAGRSAVGAKVVPTSVSPAFDTNQLVAKELVAVTGLEDDALRRNIEGGNLESTLIDLFASAAGRDIEEICLLADTAYGATDQFLQQTNGWIKLAANKVYGGAGGDFDEDAVAPATLFPENMFEAMLVALPKEHLQTRSEWRLYVSWEIENAYRNLLRARGTILGDEAQTKDTGIPYKGVPVLYCPGVERSASVGDGGAGRVALLSHPDNKVYGIFHEVTVEPDRQPKDRRTDFVLTCEVDADYEDENAAVAALIDQSPAT